MTKVIITNIEKGGTGKTELTTNQAYLLSLKGKTLIIDLDSQGHVLASFGIDPNVFKVNHIASVLKGELEWKKAIYNVKDVVNNNNLDILPANSNLRDFAATQKQYGIKVMRLIDEIKKTNLYDFIIVDTSPDIDDAVQAVWQIADLAIIPYIAEPKCNESLDELIEAIPQFQFLNKKLKVVIVPNRWTPDRKNKTTGEIIESRQIQYLKLLKTKINKLKQVYIAEPISNSEQYANALAGYNKPIVAVHEKVGSFNKPKKQQKVLNEFITSKI